MLLKVIWKYKWVYLLMLFPVLALIILFRYVPLYGIQLAFKTYKLAGIAASPWVGMEHFQRMFVEKDFWVAVNNTVIISLLKTLFGFPFPIILALMINEIAQPRYKRFLQTIYTFPHFLSWVVVAGLVLNLLGDSGAIKKVAVALSPSLRDSWNVLYDSKVFRSMLVFSDIWKEGGWGTILYLAAITSVDQSLYEAATIDGCNRLQKVLYVTLPGIVGIIVLMFILSMGNIMNANFDQVFNLYSPPVFKVGDVLDTYIYRMTFQSSTFMDFGFTTAVGFFKSIINFALLAAANYGSRAMGSDGIM
jgi:putative aldouronate transport system permease protein